MLTYLSSNLLVLIWASAAMATPLIAERIESRDLNLRATSLCPNAYESKNGMNFTTYCEMNNPFNDAMDPFKVPSMQECMERCSRYWGNGEGCFGVVWREDQNCWLRNSTTSTKNLVNDTGIHAALVQAGDMQPLDTDCPAADLSTHNMNGSYSGIGYTVHCNKVISGYDTCWEGYPECLDSPWTGYYHATSLEECLNICVTEHPLCRAVSYNPGLELGFANCWPKTGFQILDSPASGQGIIHTAAITSLDNIDTTCPSQTTYVSQNNKNFDVHCGKLNQGVNITSLHTQNITACIDTCASSNAGCIGILFDSSLQGGYQNCYLQNTTSVISDQAQATYASLSGTTIPSSSGTPLSGDNSSSGSSSSKAWIAGPVIGGIIALALIGGLVFWLRRKKSAKGAKGGNYSEAPDTSYSLSSHDHPPPIYQHEPSELGTAQRSEIEGTEQKPSTKYAHAQAANQSSVPQELPS